MDRKDRSYFHTEAIVLHSARANEADIAATFLTPRRGKLKGILKAARRSKNRFRGNLEPGGIVKLMLYFRDPGRAYERITDISVVEPLIRTRTDMHRILVMNYVLEIINCIVPFNDPDVRLYGLLKDTLILIENARDMGRITVLLRIFEVKLLMHSGIHPDLRRCSKCGKGASGELFFSLSDLAAFCGVCGPSMPEGRHFLEIQPDFFLFYHDCLHGEMHELASHGISKTVDKQSRIFFKRIFLDYLGKSLHVPRVARGLI